MVGTVSRAARKTVPHAHVGLQITEVSGAAWGARETRSNNDQTRAPDSAAAIIQGQRIRRREEKAKKQRQIQQALAVYVFPRRENKTEA